MWFYRIKLQSVCERCSNKWIIFSGVQESQLFISHLSFAKKIHDSPRQERSYVGAWAPHATMFFLKKKNLKFKILLLKFSFFLDLPPNFFFNFFFFFFFLILPPSKSQMLAPPAPRTLDLGICQIISSKSENL
jgi:hypothetical protein